jgi:hypothetical protein
VKAMTLDIPEILIVLLTAALAAWGLYNWTHVHPHVK